MGGPQEARVQGTAALLVRCLLNCVPMQQQPALATTPQPKPDPHTNGTIHATLTPQHRLAGVALPDPLRVHPSLRERRPHVDAVLQAHQLVPRPLRRLHRLHLPAEEGQPAGRPLPLHAAHPLLLLAALPQPVRRRGRVDAAVAGARGAAHGGEPERVRAAGAAAGGAGVVL